MPGEKLWLGARAGRSVSILRQEDGDPEAPVAKVRGRDGFFVRRHSGASLGAGEPRRSRTGNRKSLLPLHAIAGWASISQVGSIRLRISSCKINILRHK